MLRVRCHEKPGGLFNYAPELYATRLGEDVLSDEESNNKISQRQHLKQQFDACEQQWSWEMIGKRLEACEVSFTEHYAA